MTVARNKQLLFCSNPDCEEVLNLKDTDKKNRRICCSKCSGFTCPKCKEAWHGKDIVCKGTRGEKKEIEGAMLGSEFFDCPKCKSLVEKAGGCSMVTCGLC
mmetsp:Transcript_29610/g.45132  ORF Transcript_29610/g.45132 Transcript_29610/m.45132 type:complete len:101 (+) Transcript_29610:412-714(+)